MGIFREKYNDWGDKRIKWTNVAIAVSIIIGIISIITQF